MHKCIYCIYWMKSKAISTIKKNNNFEITKYCTTKKRKIKSDSKSCKHFTPVKIFYCEKNDNRKHIKACFYGNRYSKNGEYPLLYKECKKCRQFKKEIYPIIKEFDITTKQIKTIERREEKPKEEGYKIPRRKKKIPRRRKKKTISRRNMKTISRRNMKIPVKLSRRKKKTISRRDK